MTDARKTKPKRPPAFRPVKLSLADLLGEEYVAAVCAARAALTGRDESALLRLARRKVSFYPRSLQRRLAERLSEVGSRVSGPLARTAPGASSAAFGNATHVEAAPLTGLGYYRVGEDCRLYLAAKSEHYHAPLGHSFPGYRLVEHARTLGLPNATHNNTRGYVTRLLETKLLQAANAPIDSAQGKPLDGCEPGRLDRVLNLETGSLAVEAGIKMMLARFYRIQGSAPRQGSGQASAPPHAGATPVFGVLGDADGGLTGNYHGTAVLAQTMRGMWPGLAEKLADGGAFKVAPVRPNSIEDLEALFARYAGPERPRGATPTEGRGGALAGFLHELVLMNYGGLELEPAFVTRLYELCEQHDVPTLCDEIQSCLWAPELFLYHRYGVRPTLVAVGKGFPGGEYPASRILFESRLDVLPQFGALVTNGQEELASLCYLVTMRWAQANAAVTEAVGQYYRRRLEELAAAWPEQVETVEGYGHMGALFFRDVEKAEAFARTVAGGGVDISVQSYKPACPPAALTKLPLIADAAVVDFVVGRFAEAIRAIQ